MRTDDTLGARAAEILSLRGEPWLLPFLPLLYVAWADGDLEPDELRLIGSKVDAAEGLTPSVRTALGRWLDPDAPPSARSVQGLLAAIRRGAEGLTASQKLNLTDLGVELARSTGQVVRPRSGTRCGRLKRRWASPERRRRGGYSSRAVSGPQAGCRISALS